MRTRYPSIYRGMVGKALLPGVLMILILAAGLTFPSQGGQPPSRQDDDFKRYYTGRLGHYPIELYIEKHQKNLSGKYIQRFKLRQRSIKLSGYIDQQGRIHLEGKGLFTGSFQDGQIKGFWYRSQDSREKYPFVLRKKSPDYYSGDFWLVRTLPTGDQLKIPRKAELKRVETGELFSGRMSGLHPINKDTARLQAGYVIHLPIEDSSIISGFSLEMGVYRGIDSLPQLFPGDTTAVRASEPLRLDNRTVRLLGFEEGTTGGSYHSKLYFFQGPGKEKTYLFILSYSYTNPWVYGNPYSRQEYEGPHINDMNRLIEIVETIIDSLQSSVSS